MSLSNNYFIIMYPTTDIIITFTTDYSMYFSIHWHADFITRVEAQCSFSPTDASNIIQVACTTSEVAPDTPIAFSTCEVDEVQSEICKQINPYHLFH